MDIRKVKKLMELLEQSGMAEIEIHEAEESVRISRYGDAPMVAAPVAVAAAPGPAAAVAAAASVAVMVYEALLVVHGWGGVTDRAVKRPQNRAGLVSSAQRR